MCKICNLKLNNEKTVWVIDPPPCDMNNAVAPSPMSILLLVQTVDFLLRVKNRFRTFE